MKSNLDAMRKHYAYDKEAFEKALNRLYPALQVGGNSSLSFKAAKTQIRLTEFGQSAISLDFDGSFSLADLVFTKVGPSVDAQLAFYASLGAYMPNTELVVKAAKPKPKPEAEPKKKLLLFPKPLDGQSLEYITKKTGSNPKTLARLGVFGNGHFGTRGKVSLIYQNGTYTKVKTVTDGQKSFIIDGKKAVFFGSDLLPAFAETLYVCEGEDDAICLISLGFAAISVGSSQDAKTDFSAKLLGELKGRFDAVFSVFDADDAGRQAAKHLQDLGLCAPLDLQKVKPFLCHEIGDETNGLLVETLAKKGMDICDLFGLFKGLGIDAKGAFQRLFDYLNFTRPKAQKTTLDFNGLIYGPQHLASLDFHVKQYVSEAKDGILTAITERKRSVIWAVAGSGKTRLFQDIAAKFANKNKCERVIILLPTIAVSGQTEESFAKLFASGLDAQTRKRIGGVACFFAGRKPTPLEQEEKKIWVCVFDAAKFITYKIASKSTVIIDEFHMLISEFSYRQPATHSAFALAEKALRSILVSATPNFMILDKKLGFGYELLRVHVEQKQAIKLNLVGYDGKELKRFDLFDKIEPALKQAKENGTKVLVFYNSKSALKAAKTAFEARKIKSVIFTSDSKQTDEFAQLVETGTIAKDTTLILATSVLEAGVSVLDECSDIFYFGEMYGLAHYNRLIQLSTRPRLHTPKGAKDSINKAINVTYFYNTNKAVSKSEDEDEDTSELEDDKGRELSQLAASYKSLITASKAYETHVFKTNGLKFSAITDVKHHTVNTAQGAEKRFVMSSEVAALSELYTDEINGLTVEKLAKAIELLDSRFSFSYDVIEVAKAEDIRALMDLEDDARKDYERKALDVFEKYPLEFVSLAIETGKGTIRNKREKRIKLQMPLNVDKALEAQVLEENKTLFKTAVPFQMIVCELLKIAESPKRNDFLSICSELLKCYKKDGITKAEISRQVNREIHAERIATNQDTPTTAFTELVRKTLKRAYHDAKKEFLPSDVLFMAVTQNKEIKLASTGIKIKTGTGFIRGYIQNIWEVESKFIQHKGKRCKGYKILYSKPAIAQMPVSTNQMQLGV